MDLPDSVKPYWEAYLASLPPGASVPQRVDVWHFCDTEPCANELGELCRQGIKTATASLVWSYKEGEPIPEEGQLSIITNWSGEPLCIIETTRVYIVPFKDVDAEQAYEEGEGDRTLDYWRKAHWSFFSRELAAQGREPTEEMPVVCERFRVVG